jgi:hypothetical protein
MMTSTRFSPHVHPLSRWARTSAVFLGTAAASSLIASPVAQASSSGPALSAAAICRNVSTAALSAIVGYSLPAPRAETINLPATKKNDEISTAETSCTYGAYSLAALPKDVILEYGVTSRALTPAELKTALSVAQKINMTIVPYQGLNIKAFYYTLTETGFVIQGITGITGVKEYGAAVYTKTMPKSKIAAMVQLAEKL